MANGAENAPPPVAGEAQPVKVTKAPRAVPDTPHHQLLAAYQDALGYKLPNGAQEATGAKKILADGYTIEQTMTCYRDLKQQDFWRDKHLSLQNVAKQIGAHTTRREVTIADRAQQLREDLRRYEERQQNGK